ncbi:hypothetical protein HWN40_13210 [Methanolobus zinderi]|uniref:Uncharacterized protein n=1 Tax=Methanolobus zinderi TaxID=536044 RepID=A0A7D5I5N1_9EURY|nr:hypothetical protein [Methanolobus zinderi]QLC51108.1 hypothetical protein HWN40_13210 [Methanolobus zinderi]
MNSCISSHQPRILFLLALLLLIIPTSAEPVEMVFNGNFSEPDYDYSVSSTFIPLHWEWYFVDWGAYEGWACVFTDSFGGKSDVFNMYLGSGDKGKIGRYQYVDLTDVDELTYKYASRNPIPGSQYGVVALNDVPVKIYDVHTGSTYVSDSIDVSGYTGPTKLTFYLHDDSTSASMYFDIDDVSALTVETVDYSSYSTGTIEWNDSSSFFVGETANFQVNIHHIDNENFDTHSYYLNDENGFLSDVTYYSVIDDDEKYYEYDFSIVPDQPGVKSFEVMEYYEYYNDSIGATEWHTNVLDEMEIEFVQRPASSKSEIWTNSELIGNNTIRFYWDIENFNILTYDYWVSINPDPEGNYYSRSGVTARSGYFDVSFSESGTYTAYLERSYDDDPSDYYPMDLYSFTINLEDQEDPVDSPDIPDPEIPDNLTDPIQDDPEYEPPELDPGDGNTTINDSVLQGYYDGVDNAVNSLHGALGGFVYAVTSPVRTMKEGISTISGVGTSTMNSVSLMFAPAGAILTALFSALPESYITTGTFSIFLVIVAWIWRGVQ